MTDNNRAKLEQLGLSQAEAQVYLAILHHGPLAVAAIAHDTGIKRPSVYPTLSSLVDKGLVEGGAGYGSKFAAVPPDQALPALVVREKQTISERERIADELGQTLRPLAATAESALDETVQLVRTPQVIIERLDRLYAEAKRNIDVIIKGPILNPRLANPAQQKAEHRGVKFRGLYEESIIKDPKVAPFLDKWIAGGEEARVYHGELPYKLVVLDNNIVVLTLVGRSGQPSALLVRDAPFARSMTILFESFWKESEPLTLRGKKATRSAHDLKQPASRASAARAITERIVRAAI